MSRRRRGAAPARRDLRAPIASDSRRHRQRRHAIPERFLRPGFLYDMYRADSSVPIHSSMSFWSKETTMLDLYQNCDDYENIKKPPTKFTVFAQRPSIRLSYFRFLLRGFGMHMPFCFRLIYVCCVHENTHHCRVRVPWLLLLLADAYPFVMKSCVMSISSIHRTPAPSQT